MSISNYKYDPCSGRFFWAIKPKNGKGRVGEEVGSLTAKGYVVIRVDGKNVLAHRAAWFCSYGVWPDSDIDHVNGDKKDNSIVNLRLASKVTNNQNRSSPYITNRSGHLGIYYCKDKKRWRAEIIKELKRYRLGWYKTAEEASAAYWAAKSVLHPDSYHAIQNPSDVDPNVYGEGCEAPGGYYKDHLPSWLRPL